MSKMPSKDKIVASGALFYSKNTNRFLLLQKAQGKHAGTWGLVGGTNFQNENPWQGLHREVIEEIGFFPVTFKIIPLETFISNDKVFNFYTYLCVVTNEFIPILSKEHCSWSWSDINFTPKPLHQGLRSSLLNKVVRIKLKTIFDLIELI